MTGAGRAARLLAGAALLAGALAAQGQDFSVLGGGTQWEDPARRTYGWLLSYSHDLNEHLAASISYRNEGHVPSHHRDGQAAQIWARANPFSPDVTLAVGVGPYYYFDTTIAEGSMDHIDAHGWGAIYSFAATYRRRASPWFYQLRVDHVEGQRSLDTTLVLLGVGRRLDEDGSFLDRSSWEGRHGTRNEVVVSAGQTIVNSFESQDATAKGIEYRHAFGPVLRGSIGWINEGDARLIRRNGLVAQGWLEPSFHADQWSMGIGLGAYFAVDEYHGDRQVVTGILSMTASYHVTPRWLARLSWHRIMSNYDRDSDIILLGVGYRF